MAHRLMEPYSPPPMQPLTDGPNTTLWMGDLEPWMDETYIQNLWNMLGENVVVKVIRDKRSGVSAGYAFVGFGSTLLAQKALATVNGTRIPNTQRCFRLNWASGGGIHDRKEDHAPEYSLFVGDLDTNISEALLLSLFQSRYRSCHSAKIMTYPLTGLSRGFGFVRFRDLSEWQDALVTMNGVYCGSRPMRVSLATPKNSNARYQQLALQAPALVQQPTDPNNTTVFVGGLSTPISEEELRRYFEPFGDIVYVKIPPNKGCGFVQYVSRQSAELAIERMNGFQIGTARIRLSWGRSQSEKANSVAVQPLSPSFDPLWTIPSAYTASTSPRQSIETHDTVAAASILRNVFDEPASTSLPLSPPHSTTFYPFSSPQSLLDPLYLTQPHLEMIPHPNTTTNQDQSPSWSNSENGRGHDTSWGFSSHFAQQQNEHTYPHFRDFTSIYANPPDV